MLDDKDAPGPAAYDSGMAVPDWSRDLDRENAALRELVTVYRYLSGLALQDADLAGVVRLISDRTSATVAVLTQLMDVLTAAAPGVSAERPPPTCASTWCTPARPGTAGLQAEPARAQAPEGRRHARHHRRAHPGR